MFHNVIMHILLIKAFHQLKTIYMWGLENLIFPKSHKNCENWGSKFIEAMDIKNNLSVN